MIERAQTNKGLMLNKPGALSRADVKALFDITDWPDFDGRTVLAMNKVLNEHEMLPVLFTPMMAKEAGILRVYNGHVIGPSVQGSCSGLIGPQTFFRAAFDTGF